MKTFAVQTLGCKVNQYEGEQLAALLRSRGLIQVDQRAAADLRVVHTCSVAVQAASKSAQAVRRSVRLPVLVGSRPQTVHHSYGSTGAPDHVSSGRRPRVIVTGCWATSDPERAAQTAG